MIAVIKLCNIIKLLVSSKLQRIFGSTQRGCLLLRRTHSNSLSEHVPRSCLCVAGIGTFSQLNTQPLFDRVNDRNMVINARFASDRVHTRMKRPNRIESWRYLFYNSECIDDGTDADDDDERDAEIFALISHFPNRITCKNKSLHITY